MRFSIETYDRTYLDGMMGLYNAETSFEAHIAPLTPERFVELVEQKSYFDPAGLFIAIEAGEVVGWIHVPPCGTPRDITTRRTKSRACGC